MVFYSTRKETTLFVDDRYPFSLSLDRKLMLKLCRRNGEYLVELL